MKFEDLGKVLDKITNNPAYAPIFETIEKFAHPQQTVSEDELSWKTAYPREEVKAVKFSALNMNFIVEHLRNHPQTTDVTIRLENVKTVLHINGTMANAWDLAMGEWLVEEHDGNYKYPILSVFTDQEFHRRYALKGNSWRDEM